jgi:GTP-binding protein Era
VAAKERKITLTSAEQGRGSTAFFAIVGCPNVGKSSLLNALLGEKVAIVSAKPQTTRTRIMGVHTRGGTQFVFTDTPGLHLPRTRLGEHMVRAVKDGMDGVDGCVFVAEATGKGLRPAEENLLEGFRKQKIPVILALNKIDLLERRELLLERMQLFGRQYDFQAVVPLSARSGEYLDVLWEELRTLAGATASDGFFFPEDALTDQPERVMAAELIREQLLCRLEQELPHGIAVAIERMQPREQCAGQRGALMDVEALILCERSRHKGMIIGKQGAMLKEISTRARKELEAFFGCRVNLQCWVKVKEDWRNREGLIRDFGLQ